MSFHLDTFESGQKKRNYVTVEISGLTVLGRQKMAPSTYKTLCHPGLLAGIQSICKAAGSRIKCGMT
jgi:hypothetical protein